MITALFFPALAFSFPRIHITAWKSSLILVLRSRLSRHRRSNGFYKRSQHQQTTSSTTTTIYSTTHHSYAAPPPHSFPPHTQRQSPQPTTWPKPAKPPTKTSWTSETHSVESRRRTPGRCVGCIRWCREPDGRRRARRFFSRGRRWRRAE